MAAKTIKSKMLSYKYLGQTIDRILRSRLAESLISLYSVQFAGYILPLFTVPYLARTLGPSEWGTVAFAEAFAANLSLILEYGFGLSGSRAVSRAGSNTKARSRVASDILIAQVLLCVTCLSGAAVMWQLTPRLMPQGRMLTFSVALAIGRSLMPTWFFQGIEQMAAVSATNLILNSSASALTIAFVRHPSDSWAVLAFRSLAAISSTTFAIAYLNRHTPISRPSFSRSLSALRKEASLFLFRSATALYTSANVAVLGALASPATVGWFAGAEKFTKLAISATGPITQAFYPRINSLIKEHETEALKALKASACLMLAISASAGGVMFVLAPWLVQALLGPGFEPSIPILRVMSPLPTLISASNILGIQWMLPLGMDKSFNTIIVFAGLFNVGLATLLVHQFHALGMSESIVATEFLITVSMFFCVRRKQREPRVRRNLGAQRTEQQEQISVVT